MEKKEMRTNYLLCPGEACPLRMSCQRHQDWLNNEDDEDIELVPDYHDGKCKNLIPKGFYGN